MLMRQEDVPRTIDYSSARDTNEKLAPPERAPALNFAPAPPDAPLTVAAPHTLYDQSVLHSPTAEAMVTRLHSYMPQENTDLVRLAYAVANKAHDGQLRQSGDDYITHPVAVATLLLDLEMDAPTIAAALLHDVVEDTPVDLEDIEQLFGGDIVRLVDGVTKLSELEDKTKEELQAGTFRKMFIAMADDPRVVLIKLADRLHNMRTLDATAPEKQQRIARETLDVYAPLAHRLGIWQYKWQLEDMAFKTLNPEKYREIAAQIELRRDSRERVVNRVIAQLRKEMEREGIHAEVSGRPKHIYSIYRKMERKGVSLEHIYDQLAVRVIVNDVSECYRVLGIVHHKWKPVMSEFDDYIAVPKESMYRSLHTTVMVPGETPCEVQIRTQEMHEVAERGIAAHWRYKEGFGKSDKDFENKMEWLRNLIEWRREMTDAREFVESLKQDFFDDQVYVFTPRGKIIDLPVNSTPVDFAYRIHSEVGNRCVGAKVNGRLVSLDYHLKNGEIVSIMTSKSSPGPSRDWLNFVTTGGARNHIRRHLRRLDRGENITAGRGLLEKEMKRLGLAVAFDDLVRLMSYRSTEDLFNAIGAGDVTARQVVQKAIAVQNPPEPEPVMAEIPQITPKVRVAPGSGGTINVRGFKGIMFRFARCCNPLPGDPIVGYVTRGRGVTVHRDDCHAILREQQRERLLEVFWGEPDPEGYSVPVRVESYDRVGIWRDVSNVIADAGVNIEELQQLPVTKDGRVVLRVRLLVKSINQLARLLDKINRISNVIEARREPDEYPHPVTAQRPV